MRHAKGALRLTTLGRAYRVEVRPGVCVVGSGGVDLDLHRDDCKPGPTVHLLLDEAQALQRTLQAACDEAYRRAKQRHQAEAKP